MAIEQQRPLDISCAHLALVRSQLATTGEVTIGSSRPIIPARRAILEEIAGDRIRFVDEKTKLGRDFQITSDQTHQEMIDRARKAAERSGCWWRQVGCVVTDEQGEVFAESNNDPLVEESQCSALNIKPEEALALLKTGERLLFCSGVHDVEQLVTKAAMGNGGLGNKTWYLSLEPCDRCAGILTRLNPKAVYFSLGVGGRDFYDSLGLEFLQIAGIPTNFVKMPGEEREENVRG